MLEQVRGPLLSLGSSFDMAMHGSVEQFQTFSGQGKIGEFPLDCLPNTQLGAEKMIGRASGYLRLALKDLCGPNALTVRHLMSGGLVGRNNFSYLGAK